MWNIRPEHFQPALIWMLGKISIAQPLPLTQCFLHNTLLVLQEQYNSAEQLIFIQYGYYARNGLIRMLLFQRLPRIKLTDLSFPSPVWNYNKLCCSCRNWEIFRITAFMDYVHCPEFLITTKHKTKTKKNSVVWVRERTIPIERQPLFGVVSARFCG
jgi:hypothetical protein